MGNSYHNGKYCMVPTSVYPWNSCRYTKLNPSLNNTGGKVGICAVLLILASIVIWAYDRGNRGVKVFDWILKIMVGLVVYLFFWCGHQNGISRSITMEEIYPVSFQTYPSYRT